MDRINIINNILGFNTEYNVDSVLYNSNDGLINNMIDNPFHKLI